MSKKRNRTKRQTRAGDPDREGSRRRKKRLLNGPSLVFIGLILVIIAAVAIKSALGDRPDCPPGQVWSDAHNHCH